jgi:hypothetical protein
MQSIARNPHRSPIDISEIPLRTLRHPMLATCVRKFRSRKLIRTADSANTDSSPLDLFHRLRRQSLLLLGVCNSKLAYGFFDRLLGIGSFDVADQRGRAGADARDSPLIHFCAGTLRHDPSHTKPPSIIRAPPHPAAAYPTRHRPSVVIVQAGNENQTPSRRSTPPPITLTFCKSDASSPNVRPCKSVTRPRAKGCLVAPHFFGRGVVSNFVQTAIGRRAHASEDETQANWLPGSNTGRNRS